jgi:fucose 4-O-acetylase-like acetyltransferase
VVWGHVVQQTSHEPTWPVQGDALMRLIYTMHMPLFMGLCGYFFFYSIRKWPTIMEYARHKLPKRLLGLIIPMLTFGLLKEIISIFRHGYDVTLFSFLKQWYGMARGVWFLGDLAVNTLIVLVLWHFCNGKFRHDWKIFLLGLPLATIPKITYMSPWMYLYFVVGFAVAGYVKGDMRRFLAYWKPTLILFAASYILFSYMPWPPMDISLNYHQHSLLQLLVNDSLKIVLGISGSYLFLVLIFRMIPHISKPEFLQRAAVGGRYTLDVYLIQIILVECILGPLNRTYLMEQGWDFFNYAGMSGMLLRCFMTFLAACILLEVVLFISKLLNRNRWTAKLFFYRDVR